MTQHSDNYQYLVHAIQHLKGVDRPMCLDFGCGLGEVVSVGLREGIDIYGVDTFEGWWGEWSERVVPGAVSRIAKIGRDRLPFHDSQFDVVISNQVFEHIPHPSRVLPEIGRVLKPGGQFLALFPSREVWYEGHVGLYFAHRLQRRPRLLRTYLIGAEKVGLGLNHHGVSGKTWVDSHFNGLTKACFYHRRADVLRWWREVFRAEPISLAAHYVEFRLKRFAGYHQWIPARTKNLLFRVLCNIRVGSVLLTVNNKA